MNIQSTTPATPLRQRMIEDMRGRNLGRVRLVNPTLNGCCSACPGRAPEPGRASTRCL